MLRELVQAQGRFPSLFAAATEPKALFQLDGTLVEANEAALDLIGATSERPLAEADELLPHCDRIEVRDGFRSAASGKNATVTTSYAKADGTARTIEIIFTPAVVDRFIVGVHATGREIASERATVQHGELRVQELTTLFERHPDSMIALDASGRCFGLNAAGEKLTGYRNAELLGRPYSFLIAPQALPETTALFSRALLGETVSGCVTLRRRDGAEVDVSGMCVPILIDGNVVGIYAIGRSTVDGRSAERDVQADRVRELYLVAASSERTSESQIRAALTLGAERLECDGGYVTRIDGERISFLHGSGDVGYAADKTWRLADSLHRHVVAEGRAFSVDEIPETVDSPGSAAPHAARAFIGTPLVVGGEPFGTLCFVNRTPRSKPFTEADRDFVRLIGTLAASAIERGDQRERLSTLAFFDALTGLPNRVLLSDRLVQAIATAQRESSQFAVHFYDLDGFKHINDAHGHLRGDDVLRLVAHRFQRIARDVDTVARVGGDEFVIVQPGIRGIDDALSLANRLRVAVAEPFIVDGRERRLSTSGGIALYPQDGSDAATLIARADAALYRVKGDGRDDIACVIAGDA